MTFISLYCKVAGECSLKGSENSSSLSPDIILRSRLKWRHFSYNATFFFDEVSQLKCNLVSSSHLGSSTLQRH